MKIIDGRKERIKVYNNSLPTQLPMPVSHLIPFPEIQETENVPSTLSRRWLQYFRDFYYVQKIHWWSFVCQIIIMQKL